MMKVLFLLPLLLVAQLSFSQYGLGKPADEIFKDLPGYKIADVVYNEKDSLNVVSMESEINPKFKKVFFFDMQKDSCVREYLVFTNKKHQLTYMKSIEENWIKISDKKWRTYINGNIVIAEFFYVKDFNYDCLQFKFKKLD